MSRTFTSRLAPVALVALSGCLTPGMGRKADLLFDFAEGKRKPAFYRASAWEADANLPTRIWYGDQVARVFHERRTNTFIAWDESTKNWIALPREEALARFHPGRAQLLPKGAPEEVEKVLDYLLSLEPKWEGT